MTVWLQVWQYLRVLLDVGKQTADSVERTGVILVK